jgi:hypothetical protein
MMMPLVNLAVVLLALTTPQHQSQSRQQIPFGVGEKLTYDVKYGAFRVGTGSMEITGIDTVRGRDAWHAVFLLEGSTPLGIYRVDDRYESWIDTTAFASLRFHQNIREGGYRARRRYEIYPERAEFTENDKPAEASVAAPLDDASFIYFVRTVPLEIGREYTYDRYFRADRNPVRIRVLRRERVSVPSGTYQTVVVQPTIKTSGLFSENGHAEIYIAEDSTRLMVKMHIGLSFGSLSLHLKSVQLPNAKPPKDTIP